MKHDKCEEQEMIDSEIIEISIDESKEDQRLMLLDAKVEEWAVATGFKRAKKFVQQGDGIRYLDDDDYYISHRTVKKFYLNPPHGSLAVRKLVLEAKKKAYLDAMNIVDGYTDGGKSSEAYDILKGVAKQLEKKMDECGNIE